MDSLLSGLNSNDLSQQLQSLKKLRDLLSKGELPVQDLNHHGIFPLVISVLKSSNDQLVREQSVLVLGQLSSISETHRILILDYQGTYQVFQPFLDELCRCLSSQDPSTVRDTTHYLSAFFSAFYEQRPPYSDLSDNSMKALVPALASLMHSQDEQVLVNVCTTLWALSDPEQKHAEEKTASLVQVGAAKNAIELLGHSSSLVQNAALKLLLQIASGFSEHCKQNLLDNGIIAALIDLILRDGTGEKELSLACWITANLSSDNPNRIQIVIDHQIIPLLLQKLPQFGAKTKTKAVWVFSNIAASGTPQQIQYLVNQGCIKILCHLLEEEDDKVLSATLDAMDHILQAGQQDDQEEIQFAVKVSEANGEEKLEGLLNYGNQGIQQHAERILQTYFSEDGVPHPVIQPQAQNLFQFSPMPGGFQF